LPCQAHFDDVIAVLDGRAVRTTFRELDMARRNGGPKLIRRIAGVLRDAGAVWAPPLDRHARVLGPVGAPDLRPPAPLPARPRAADVVTEALRRDIARLLTNDPLVRLRMDADDDTSVHRMRVGVRRLRSDLRTFAPLLDHAWSRPLREELRWLGGVLGAARDAEVLRARLRRTAAADLLAPLDEIAVARIDADLAARHEDARAALDDALASSRYRALVETLYAVAACPAVTPAARRRAGAVLPPIVACDLRRMACGRPSGAAPDADWHALRRRAKRTRYAVETLAPVAGPAAVGLATALADLTDLLGTHTDACLAGRLWLDIAAADPDDHVLAVTAGRLYERERATVRETRRAYPGVWRQLRRGTVSGWLR
jgi:CHAD domain-containing protein